METRSSLIRRVRNLNDQPSWDEFWALYQPLLLDYVRSRGLQEHDARDVVQNIYLKLRGALPKFELDRQRGRFRTWLWTVTMSAIGDWQRGRKRQSRVEGPMGPDIDPPGPPPSPGPEDAEWVKAHRQRVLDFVLERVRDQSQPKTWACFEQHILRGRPSAEVAAELRLTANSVYVNASRVLARVREQCADYEEDLGDE
jgi:RNA polymerase sigma-70 factor (ECF subfamily)